MIFKIAFNLRFSLLNTAPGSYLRSHFPKHLLLNLFLRLMNKKARITFHFFEIAIGRNTLNFSFIKNRSCKKRAFALKRAWQLRGELKLKRKSKLPHRQTLTIKLIKQLLRVETNVFTLVIYSFSCRFTIRRCSYLF